jgi:hypothetical protein
MRRPLRLLPWRTSPRPENGAGLPAPAVTRSEAEGEGLHKRSAEAWGNPLHTARLKKTCPMKTARHSCARLARSSAALAHRRAVRTV